MGVATDFVGASGDQSYEATSHSPPTKGHPDPSIDHPRRDVTTVSVDYRDDEGTRLRKAGLLQGAMPIMFASPVATGGECTFAVDCIDGDPCTADSCDIEPGSPFGSGKCLNEPVDDGVVGGCSDGLFCNGLETCQGGVCEDGIPATCCTGEEVCMEDWGVCDDKSLNAGDPCQLDGNCRQGPSGDTVRCDRCRPDCRVRLCNDGSTTCTANGDCPAVTGRCSNAARSCTTAAECPGGTCNTGPGTCLTNNQVCDDGNYCNGVETCDMGDGVCLTSTNPCGPGADCFFKKCTGGDTPNANCSIDANCPGGVCRIVATPVCFLGRCCNQATAEPACGKSNAATCSSQGREWYAGDGGQQTGEIGQNCGGFNPEVPVADAWGCPKYGSGITQTNMSDAPVYVETIGPISGSPSSVTIGSFTGPLNSVGDDYVMTNTSHFGLDVLRFVGGLIVPNRIAIDFYDSSGNFIEDIILPPIAGTGQQTIVVAFNPALILPPEGFVVWRIAGNFSPNAQMFIMSTNDFDTGDNDPDVLWRNGASVANFLPNGAPGYLSFELVGDKTSVPTGACCDPDTGDCNSEVEWVCRGSGGSFQEGLPCSQCVNGVNNGNPCRTCDGGGNDGNACEANSECPDGTCAPDNAVCAGAGSCSNDDEALCPPSVCPGIAGVCSNSINLCTIDAQCPGGTCGGAGSCLPGTCETAGCSIGACCIAGDCEPDHTPTSCAMASGIFQDFGSNCDNNCCEQPVYSGADQPADATLHMINMPAPGADPVTITISGDNSTATSTVEAPDTCFGAADTIGDDPGWWEQFSIDACAHVRIDFCCTSPVHAPAWAFLSADPDCNVTLANGFPPDEFGEADNARGAPYCVEDNLWQWYTFLPAGTYYYPIYSVVSGHIGEYQLHITVEACTLAACCKPDGSCEDGLNQQECDTDGGLFLAPPQRSPSVAACTPGVCDSGSCCTAPGTCEDDRENAGDPMTKVVCEGPGFEGIYVPNVKCEGGRCAGNDLSCNDDIDCTGGNGPCLGDAEQKAQENPCPICEHNTDSKCQHDPGARIGTAYLADLSSTVSPTRIADDVLITTTGTLNEVCVIGYYVDFTGGAHDCNAKAEFEDQFTVRVYEIDSLTNYVPGVRLGEYQTLVAENENKPEYISGDRTFFRYQLTLVPDGQNPLPELLQDQIYFIEVSNNTVGEPAGCNWFWINARVDQGNDIFYQELGTNYTVSDAETADADPSVASGDVPICLNVQFTWPPTPVRACCTCDPQNPCQDTTLGDCRGLGGEWQFNTLSCTEPGFACAVAGNDSCATSRVVGDGFQFWNNFCAELDGPTESACDDFDVTATNDLWYHYTASCSGVLTASLCDPQDDFIFDSVVYVYNNSTNPAVCACPADGGFAQTGCNDEGCTGFAGLTPGEVQVSVVEGNCYTIRVAGFAGSAFQGVGKLRITCGDAVCGDNNRDEAAGEQCDGTDDALCDGECTVDCMCPTPVCGDNVAATLLGEVCDGTDDAACDGLCRPPGDPLGGCTCPPVCGNGVREAPELCDGNDDALCPGLCIPGPDPNECRCVTTCGNNNAEVGEACDGTDDDACPGACVDCTCPPAACGNNIVEVSLEEECDGTATEGALCDPEECRPPGDPAGQCTCQCGSSVIVDEVLPESPAVGKVRHISFVVQASSVGTDTALRVQLTSLHHPSSPPPGTPNFAAFEGGFRYVNSFGGSTTCVDSATFATNYRCGQLGCQPEYRDWSTALASATNPASAAGLIHVTGDTVVPSSTLNVSHIAAACGAAPGANSCTAASATLAISTSRWGDVGSGGGGPPDGAANVIDIGLVVDNVKGLVTAIPERRAWMKNPPNTFLNPVNVIDIGLTVDAVKGLPYPYTISVCP